MLRCRFPAGAQKACFFQLSEGKFPLTLHDPEGNVANNKTLTVSMKSKSCTYENVPPCLSSAKKEESRRKMEEGSRRHPSAADRAGPQGCGRRRLETKVTQRQGERWSV